MLVASPLWLAGLLAVPLIWWLHRAAGHGRRVDVPSLLPFRDVATEGAARQPARRADPAWLRRALAAAALALALADISLVLRNRNATAWLDDSLSMTTAEAGGTRLALALAQLRALRDSEHLDSLEIRSLSEPATRYNLDQEPPRGGERTLHPPAATALSDDREQWLVTDGTSAALQRWSASTPLQKLLLIGTTKENVALVSLAARPSLAQPDLVVLELTAYNAGTAPATRKLTLSADGRVVAQPEVTLAAGEQRSVSFKLPLPHTGWTAQLSPSDALVLDDAIELSALPLRPAIVLVGTHCPAFVAAALRAVPLLRVQRETGDAVDGRIRCAGDDPATAAAAANAAPTLRLQPDPASAVERNVAVWTDAARAQLQSTDRQPVIAARGVLNTAEDTDAPLLRSPSGVLAAVSQTQPHQLRATLEFANIAPADAAQTLPVLVRLLELTLQRSLLAPVAAVNRDPAESQVGALSPLPVAHAGAMRAGSRPLNLTWLLLALAASLLAWDLILQWRAATGGRTAMTLKTLSLAALLAAVLLPRWSPSRELPPLAFLLDLSASMPSPQTSDRWQALLAEARALPHGQLDTLAFAGNVVALTPDVSTTTPVLGAVDPGGTNVAGALDAAMARLPAQSAAQFVVVSDGWSQRGDTEATLRRARSAGVTVNWLPLGSAAPAAQLRAVHAPAAALVGERISVAVDVTAAARRDLRLVATLGNAPAVTLAPPTLPAGRSMLWLTLDAQARGEQLLRLQLRDAATDELLDERAPAASIDVGGAPQALYVAHGDAPLARSLREGGWSVALLPPAALAQQRSLDENALIVLDDIGAGEAPAAFWNSLEQAVSVRGAGLLVLGGPRSFAAGGYRGSPLESLLPVTVERGRREQRAAVLFALDKSGSMDGAAHSASRLAYAREAVLHTLAALAPTDRAAVLSFDVSTSLLAPFDTPAQVANRLRQSTQLSAFGGTRAVGALREAADLLARQTASRRVLVLVSDGFLPEENLAAALAALAAGHVEFIALGVGSGGQFAALKDIATRTHGELFVVDEAAELPRLMRQRLDAGLGSVTRGPLDVHAVAALPFAMTANPGWPRVLNYAVSRLRQNDYGLLESAQGEPVLAARQSGSGRVAVMPAGLGAWAPDWPAWPQWPQFAGSLATWLAGVQGSGRLALDLRAQDGDIVASIDASDGKEWSSAARPALQFSDPQGRSIPAAVHGVGPGRYSGRIAATSLGRYRATLTTGDGVLRRSVLRDADDENATRGINPAIDRWVREGLVRYLPAGGVAALTTTARAGASISVGWLLAAWLGCLAAVLADCAGVSVGLWQRWRGRRRR